MSDEALLILKMVQEGKMTPEQGVSFLEALKTAPHGESAGASSSAASASSASSADYAPWSSVSLMQRKLAEVQQRLGEMQAKLGAAQVGSAASGIGGPSPGIKLPFGMGEFNLTQVLDEAVKGVSALKTEAVISAKKAARQAQKEGRRIRQEAEKMGKNIHVEVYVTTEDRPRNVAGLPEMSRRDEVSFDLPDDGVVAINNPYGDVKVTGSSADGKVHVTTDATVWAQTRDECEKCLQGIRVADPTSEPSSGYEVDVIVAQAANGHVAVNTIVQTPPHAQIEAKTSFGQVLCESLEGGVRKIETLSGDVRILRVHAPQDGEAVPATVQTRSGGIGVTQWRGGAVTATTISGSVQMDMVEAPALRINTHSGDALVRSSKLAGECRFESISGDMDVQDVDAAGGCLAKTQSGDIEMINTSVANLTLETVSGDVTASDSRCGSGTAVLKSISGDIEASHFQAGDVSLTTTSGDLSLNFGRDFTGSVAGASVSGDIVLELPSTYSAKLTLTTHSGTMQCDCPLDGKQGDGQHFLSGQIGGAPQAAALTLQSVSGDLCVKRASA